MNSDEDWTTSNSGDGIILLTGAGASAFLGLPTLQEMLTYQSLPFIRKNIELLREHFKKLHLDKQVTRFLRN